jgi:hypothetical protein
MAVYRHTQPGILNRLIIGAFILVVIVLAVFLGEGDPTAMWVMLMVSGILLVALALFHSLTVEIRHGRLRIRFGVGLIRKTIAVKDIEQVETARNRWWYGWGIRLTPHGWLFNVSGLDAVQVRLRNGRSYRIGTDEPEKLCAAIEEAMRWAR